jgi:hypothetical protein
MPAEPFISGQLRFRGISDSLAKSHLEGSECCLIHVDNPLRTKGTYVNPQVRVGYNGGAYTAVHPHGIPPSFWGVYKALLGNRIRRWSTTLWIKEWGVRRTVAQWRRRTKEKEAGEICLINEMQVLAANGWAHV